MPWFGKYWTRRELWREVHHLRSELALARQGGGAGFVGASVTRFPGRSELALRVGTDDRIHQVSHSLAEALGRASHELAGQPLAAVDRFEWGAGYLADLARRAREVGDTLHEWRDFFQDGRDRAYALRATPLEGGGVSLIMQDLSEHRRLERGGAAPPVEVSTEAGADQGLVWTERQVDLKGIGRLTAFQVAKGR